MNKITKIIKKLKETKGADTTVETSGNIFVYIVIFFIVISAFGVMYKEYQLHIFASELMRTAELYGEVGTETTRRQEELEKNLGIKPKVTWGKIGTYSLNEKITLNLTLDVGVKLPFFKSSLTLSKNATGTSEVYRK